MGDSQGMAEAGDSGAGPSDPQDPMVGRVIDGRYLLERKLGQGGMGKVYLARQVRMNRPVAVKVVHAEHSSDPDLRARFLREAVALAQVSHPNVLLAHDNGVTEDGLLYLVTELLEGHPLDRLVAASPHRRLPLAPTLSILRQLALALEAVHPHLIHRDLKPHNVMVRSEP
ncbi:MAG: serine/threonine-protein kinase, partial [Myxococcota bacterium]